MRDWKYRFKRGLASFLTVGMIASGVGVTTCLPVYAEEESWMEEETYQRFLQAGLSTYADFGSKRLKGASKEIYEQLKEKIKSVSEGECQRAEFTFDIQCSEDEFKKLVANEEDSKELSQILSFLLMDCPSELYWYDKASEGSFSFSSSYQTGSNYELPSTVKFKIQLVVSAEYRQEGGDIFSIDTGKTKASYAAIQTAKGIVEYYEGKSDYEKLRGYKEVICDLVDYDHNAASEEYQGGMGPWQLVSVFDDNPETNVVCEGYSKAFQYLCDLSTFEDAICYTVTGTMDGGTGSGRHMWNIVRIGDKSYIADITNSDFGSIGNSGGLFLRTADGNVEDGYTFSIGYSKVTYKYDSDQVDLFGMQILTLSDTPYDASSPGTKKDQSDFEFMEFRGTDVRAVHKMMGDPDFSIRATGAVDDSQVTYTSSDTKVATVNAKSGEVHIVGAGGTIIQATASETADYNAKTVKYYLSVQLRTQTEFKIDLDKLGIDVPVGAIGAPEINVPVGTDDFTIPVSGQAEGSIVQFTSNNLNVATVDANGRVHIVGKGTAGIAVTATETAIYERKTIPIYINVTSSGSTSGSGTGGSGGGIVIGGIGGGIGGSGYTGNVTEAGSASPRELLPQVDFSFHAGSPKILKSVGAPDFAITASGQVVDSKITYASSDPSVATVDVNTGTVHVVGSGNVTITATASETTLHRAETCAYELEVQ